MGRYEVAAPLSYPRGWKVRFPRDPDRVTVGSPVPRPVVVVVSDLPLAPVTVVELVPAGLSLLCVIDPPFGPVEVEVTSPVPLPVTVWVAVPPFGPVVVDVTSPVPRPVTVWVAVPPFGPVTVVELPPA
jgi:hypothetical protein